MKNEHNRVMDLAYIRSGQIVYTDESVILACLIHSKGKGRGTKSKDLVDELQTVQRIMKDQNLEPSKTRKR